MLPPIDNIGKDFLR